MTGVIIPPDGGFGWVMVACSFYVHLWTIGLCFSLGGLYYSWLQEFNESKALTSWIVSVCVAFLHAIGPIPSALMSKYGNKIVGIIGAVLGCVGFALSYFATSVTELIVTIGIVGGIGVGFAYMPAITMIAEYFEKRRALAYGIATAGAGIGNFLLSPMIAWLEDIYGWRGTLLLVGAMLLNLCAVSMIMKPLEQSYSVDISIPQVQTNGVPLLNGDNLHDENVTETERYGHKTNGFLKDPESLYLQVSYNSLHATTSLTESESSILAPETKKATQSPLNKVLDNLKQEDPRNGVPRVGGSLQMLNAPTSNTRQFASASELRRTSVCRSSTGIDGKSDKGSFKNIDMLFFGSIHSLRIIDEKIGSKHKLQYDSFKESDEEEHNESEVKVVTHTSRRRQNIFSKSLTSFIHYLSALKDPSFLSLAINQLLVNLSYLMPVLYMVDRAVENGIPKSYAVSLMSINGIGNLIGRFLFGTLGDLPRVDATVLYMTTLTLCGVGTCLSPLCGDSFILHGVYAAFFGCTMGGYVSLCPVVATDTVGVERIKQLYSILLFCMGSAGAVGPPLAGWVYQWTGDFTVAYILHGIWIILSAAVLLPVTISKHLGRRREL